MKLSLQIIIGLMLVISFSSWKESKNEIQKAPNPSIVEAKLRSDNPNQFVRNGVTFLQGPVSITCSTESCEGGNLGPHNHCQVGTDTEGKFECSFSGCTMTVVADQFQSNIDIWKQIYSEDLHLNEFADLTEEIHGERMVTFNSVDFYFQPLVTTILYNYRLADGSEETLMYVNTYTESGMADKTYAINCSGTCGCRGLFNLDTATVECSCDECSLTVTVSEAQINREGIE